MFEISSKIKNENKSVGNHSLFRDVVQSEIINVKIINIELVLQS